MALSMPSLDTTMDYVGDPVRIGVGIEECFGKGTRPATHTLYQGAIVHKPTQRATQCMHVPRRHQKPRFAIVHDLAKRAH
jgi:hypothetical protein